MKKLLIAFLLISSLSFAMQGDTPYDPGAMRKDGSNASTTIAFPSSAVSGVTALNGVAPMTAAEKTQALVGSSTVDFSAKKITLTEPLEQKPVDAVYGTAKRIRYTMPRTAIATNGVYTTTVPSGGLGEINILIGTSGQNIILRANNTTLLDHYNLAGGAASVTKNTATNMNFYFEGGFLCVQNTTATSQQVAISADLSFF